MSNIYKPAISECSFFRKINENNSQSFGRRLLFLVIFFAFNFASFSVANAQMIELSFADKIQQSTLIVEAKVVQKQSFWNDNNSRIFTANELEIYKVFKGQLPSGTHQIITQGGIVGNNKHEVCPSLQLKVGDIGVFILKNSTANLSAVSGLKLSPIAESQAFYRYNEISGKAVSPFDFNQSVNQLHTAVQSQTNQIFTQNIPYTFEAFEFSESGLPPMISAISPTSLNGGVGDILTITGTGFGFSLPTSKVLLSNAEVGGLPNTEEITDFITWNDSVILFTVPNRGANGFTVGSGNVEVVTQLGTAISTQVLDIKYNHSNVLNMPNTFGETQHMDKNGLGGYTFVFNNAFDATFAGSQDAFDRALETWRCATRINWAADFINNTPTSTAANDGVNLVNYVTTITSLATTYSYYSNCGGNDWYVEEMDIEFLSVMPWHTDTTMPAASDFDLESVTLHGLGHAHQLDYVADILDPMYYAIQSGQTRRTLIQNNIDGGVYVKDKSVSVPICGQPLMIIYPQCPQPLSCNVSLSNAPAIVCNGDSTNISAYMSVSGGIPVVSNNLNYYLSYNGTLIDSVVNTTDTIVYFNGLSQTGTYLVSVIDDSTACSAVDSIILNFPSQFVLTTYTNNTSAVGVCDGSASVFISGGIPNYTYVWSDANGIPVSVASVATNLCTGTYSVCITDALGCTICDTVQIYAGGCQLFISGNSTVCSGDTAFVNATMIGGGGTSGAANAFQFTLVDSLWFLVDQQSYQDSTYTFALTNPGMYILSVINNFTGCAATDTFYVTVNSAITASVVSGNTSLPGACDGWATVTTTSGLAPYTYQWDSVGVTISSNNSIANLCEGWYSYSITDANGCYTTDSIEIILVPCDVQLTQVDSILCNGDDNASIQANAVGVGVGPNAFSVRYLYSLYSANPTQLQAFVATNNDSILFTLLSPATYFVTIYDSSYGAYCFTDTLVITEPAPLAAFATIDTCSNAWTCDGDIIVDSVTGGITPYTYQWFDANNNLVSINPFVNNICFGNYQLYVTDANGCVNITNYEVPFFPSCDSSSFDRVIVNNVPCFGDSTGSIVIFPDSIGIYSMPPFTFIWMNDLGDTLRTDVNMMGNGFYGNLPAGNYSVTMIDANGCTAEELMTITENPPIVFDLGADIIIPCGTDTLLTSGEVSGGVTVSDTSLFSTFTMFLDSVTDTTAFIITTDTTANNIDYLLVVSGTYMHTDSTFFDMDAAYNYSDTTAIMDWIWNGTSNNRPTPDVYSPIHTYNYPFVGNGFPQNFVFDDTIYSGVLFFQIYEIRDTNIYTYLWQPTGDITDSTLAYPGTTPTDYILTVTDAVGCSATDTVNVAWDLYILDFDSVATTNIACYGDSTGDISVWVDSSSGFGPYWAICWINAGLDTILIDSTFIGLPNDTFTVYITDSLGCLSADTTLILTQPSAPVTTITTDTAFTCYLDSIGQGFISAQGGTPYTIGDSYTYSWEDASGTIWSTNDTINNLPAGTYYATTTDSLGCFVIDTMEVFEPNNSINMDSILVVDVLCKFDSTGSISASFSGGFTPYSVILMLNTDTMHTQGLIDSAVTITGLPYGYYDLLVYDSINCIKSYSVFIDEPQDSLSSSIHTLTDVSCWGDTTGQAIVTVIGGQFPYTHLWGNGETNALNANMNAGWHTVISTDANGCTIADSVEIFHINPQIQGSVNIIQNVSCFNGCDGIASISSFGGVLPHVYTWSNGQIGTYQPDTTFNLCFGTQYIIIEDAVGCRVIDSVFIDQPDELRAQAVWVAHVTCYGFDNGIAHATGTGGTLPYSFVWDSVNGQAGDSAFNLTPGTHTVFLTDGNGCMASDTVVITQPDLLEVEIIDSLTILPYCAGVSTASLTATAWGGTEPYNYSWSLIGGSGAPLNQFDSVATNLLAGIYSVIVMDDRNCIASDTMDIDTLTNTMNGYAKSDSISCFGLSDGVAYAIVDTSGLWGYGPYTYDWFGQGGFNLNNGPATINNLLFGTYSVIIRDTNNCIITRSTDVKQPDKLEYTTYHVINETCDGSCDGQVYVDISGGTGPFRFEWTNTNGNSTSFTDPGSSVINDSIIPNLCNAEYDFYITDTNGCQGYVLWGGRWQEIVSPDVTVVGNVDPSKTIDSDCFNTPNGSASVLNPNPLYTYAWYNLLNGAIVDSGITATNLSGGLPGGTYSLLTYYADSAGYYLDYLGCTDTSTSFTIGQPNQINPNYQIDHVKCYDDSDGKIIISNIFGGTSPSPSPNNFDILWNPNGSTSNILDNLIAGTYTVSITDDVGCEFIDTIEITEPDPLTTDIATTDVICNGDATGAAIITSVGGTSPYNENWGAANPNALTVGVYPVTITDANGCEATDTAIINQPLSLITSAIVSSNYSGADISCNGANDGKAIVSLSGGGLGTLNYDWQPGGQSTAEATNLAPGNYIVTVTDGNGCSNSASVTLTEPAPLLANITFDETISCYNACDGWVDASPSGGTPLSVSNYQYTWTNASGTTVSGQSGMQDLCAGNTFTVLVEDANGCTTTSSTPLFTEPAQILGDILALDTGAAHPPFPVMFTTNTLPTSSYNYIYNVDVDGSSVLGGMDNNSTFWITFTNPGANEVTFFIEDQANIGCYDTITMTIHVQGIDVPNVFTPNGDGVNDLFVVDNHGMETLNMLIFNRWGSKVYEWNTTQTAWDGTGLDGENVADGVYFYVLTAVGEDGHPYEERGSVTLIR